MQGPPRAQRLEVIFALLEAGAECSKEGGFWAEVGGQYESVSLHHLLCCVGFDGASPEERSLVCELVRRCVAAGWAVNDDSWGLVVNGEVEDGLAPLHLAASKGAVLIVEVLLETGADAG